jgi:hypothetical protein
VPFAPAPRVPRPSSPSSPPTPPAASRRALLFVWSALAAATAVAPAAAFLGARLVPPAPEGRDLGTVLLLVAASMVAVELVVAYVLTARIRRTAPPGDGSAATQTIVASALAAGAAIACSVFHFVTGEPLLLPLAAPPAAVLLHWFPSEARWARLGGAAPAAGPGPRRPMVRR